MPATRARSTAPRFDSLKPTTTPSPPRGTRHNCRSPFSDGYENVETTMPLTVKRKDAQQQKRPQTATDPNEVIEISDDDDDEPSRPLNSQTSMIADFRRQINKLREVWHLCSVQWRSLTRLLVALCVQESVKHKKDHERAVRELNILREENQQLQALRKPGTLVVKLLTFFESTALWLNFSFL